MTRSPPRKLFAAIASSMEKIGGTEPKTFDDFVALLDKAKAAAEQAAAKAKEGVEDVQTKRELGQTQSELGRIAFELVDEC